MAIQNTGLGWYADENWLKQSDGAIGSISSINELSPVGNYFFGTCQTSQVPSSAPLGYIGDNSMLPVFLNDNTHEISYYGKSSTDYFFYMVRGGASQYFVARSAETLTIREIFGRNNASGWDHTLNLSRFTQFSDGYNIYKRATGPENYYYPGNYFFNSVEDGRDYYLANVEPQYYYKLNSGYAVTGFVKYKTNSSTTVLAPFAISSTMSYTTLSTNGSTSMPMSQSVHAKDNMVFYLSVGASGLDDGEVSGAYVNFAPLILDDAALFRLLAKTVKLGVGSYNGDNPYEEMGTTESGGGGGTMEIISTPVVVPDTPEFAITDAGFFSVWLPDELQIKKIAAWMWNGNVLTINFWKRMVTSPTDLILGLSMVPFVITPDGQDNVALGYINTGLLVDYTNSQFFELDFGSIDVEEVWGAYIDYNPYTTVEIFLPYIGSRRLDVDEIMNKTIHLVYKIDIISGACVAIIAVTDYTDESEETVLYQFMGNCSTQIPVTAEEMVNIVRNTVNLVTSAATFAFTGGQAGEHEAGASGRIAAHKAAGAGIISSAANLATTKQTANRTGSVSSAAGFLGVQRPYLIFKRPNQAMPDNQQHYTGFPSFITENLGDLEGYTEVEAIHLENIPCTDKELDEIEALLKGGVIF